MTHPAANLAPLREVIRPTTLIKAPRLASRLGVDLILASETFQLTGSFKFRAAYNVAASVRQQRVITASSGNFGQAMAYACRLLGKSCVVVMPHTSSAVKVEAVREFGGRVELVDVRVKARQVRVQELAKADPEAYVASAYDDPLVIQGNASLGQELGDRLPELDAVVAPIGGGGLTSGLVAGLRPRQGAVKVFGAEPALANDASQSLAAGRIVALQAEPATLADGARVVAIGSHNWEILRDGLAGIVEASEDRIREAVRLLFHLANLKAEPTGALSVAALLANPQHFVGKRVCCVISGGNVDPAVFQQLIS